MPTNSQPGTECWNIDPGTQRSRVFNLRLVQLRHECQEHGYIGTYGRFLIWPGRWLPCAQQVPRVVGAANDAEKRKVSRHSTREYTLLQRWTFLLGICP